MSGRAREVLLVTLLFVALVTAFFSDAVFSGLKLVPADILYRDPVFSGYAPADFTTPHNILLYDQIYQFYPWRVYTQELLRQRTVPLWNPYVYCGAPLLAEEQAAVFFPLNVLSYAFAPEDALLFTAIARLVLAALSMWGFVRLLGLGKAGSLLASLAFAFSGFMVVWLGHPHSNVAAFLPALFLAEEWLFKRVTAGRVAFLAIIVAAHLTGGHAETALYTLSAGALYFLCRTLAMAHGHQREASCISPGPRFHVRVLFAAFAVAALLGSLLAAVDLIPFGEWLWNSAELRFRTASESLRNSGLGPRYWMAGLAVAILPNLFGNPTWAGEYQSFFEGWNFVEQTLYVGVLPLALAVLVCATRLQRSLSRLHSSLKTESDGAMVWFWCALSLVSLGAALRMPVADWVNHLPLFEIAAYGRMRVVYSFAVAVLAGLGLDMIVRSGSRSMVRLLAITLALTSGLGVALFVSAPSALASMAERLHGGNAGPALLARVSPVFRWANVEMLWPVWIAALGCVVCIIWRYRSASFAQKNGSRHAVFCAALIALTVVDLFALGRGYHTTVQDESILPKSAALQPLMEEQDLFRFVATNVDMMPNTSMMYGLQDVRGLDFPTDRYQDFCKAIGGKDWLGYGLLFGQDLKPRLLGLTNVKYVLSSSPSSLRSLDGLRLRQRDGTVEVYENLLSLPRSFVVHQAQVANSPEEALQLLLNPQLDLRTTVVLEKGPPRGVYVSTAAGEENLPPFQAGSDVQVVRYGSQRVTLTVDTTADGLLFVSDSYYPGWRAYVDDEEVEIYRADYAFRAVSVTAGRHSVDFVYAPVSFRVGVLLSGLGALFTLSLLIAPKLGQAVRRLRPGPSSAGV